MHIYKEKKMTQWTPKLEKLIRELGEYTEKQMRDLLNPEAAATLSALRITFRGFTRGLPAMKKTCAEAGLDFENYDWLSKLQKLAEIADQNNSDAADKIKKALPIANQLEQIFKQTGNNDPLSRIKTAKQQNIKY